MKKIFFIFTVCLAILTTGTCCFAFHEKQQGDFSDLDNNGTVFLLKFQTCSPAKNEVTKEVIHGKGKNGMCHYSYKETNENGSETEYYCIMPMQIAIGYATTALDVFDYAKSNPDISLERLNQNNEIGKIMQDYCKMVVK